MQNTPQESWMLIQRSSENFLVCILDLIKSTPVEKDQVLSNSWFSVSNFNKTFLVSPTNFEATALVLYFVSAISSFLSKMRPLVYL